MKTSNTHTNKLNKPKVTQVIWHKMQNKNGTKTSKKNTHIYVQKKANKMQEYKIQCVYKTCTQTDTTKQRHMINVFSFLVSFFWKLFVFSCKKTQIKKKTNCKIKNHAKK